MPDEAKRLPNYARSAYLLIDTVGNRMAYLSAEAFADVARTAQDAVPAVLAAGYADDARSALGAGAT